MTQLIRAHLGLILAGVGTFILMGAGQSLYGPALPAYARLFDLPLAQAGRLISAHWVGCFLGVGFMFFRGARVGPLHTLAVMAAGAGLLAVQPGWEGTLLAGLIFGAGYGMATAVFNPRMLRVFGSRGPSMLSLLNAMFGVGAIVAPLAFVALGSNPRLTFGGVAVLCAVLTLIALRDREVAPPPAPVAGSGLRLHPGILACGLVAIGLEACLIGLGPVALIRAGAAEAQAAELLSAFFVVFLGARVALIFTAHLVPGFTLFTLAMAGTSACAAGAVVISPQAFFVAMGLFAGLFFPGFYVTAARKMGDDPRVPPVIIAAGLVGGIFSPLLLAPLVERMADRGFFQIVLAVTLVMTAVSALSLRRMNA